MENNVQHRRLIHGKIDRSPLKPTRGAMKMPGQTRESRPLSTLDLNRNGGLQHGVARNGKGTTPKKVSIIEKGGSTSSMVRAAATTTTESNKSESFTPALIEETRKGHDGKVTIHKYLRGKMLGKGGFAKVYLCTALDTNKNYAIKIVPKANLMKTRARQKLQAEIKIHRTLKHEYICEYKHFFEDRHNCYILLELCDLQSMNELIRRRKKLTEPEVQYFMLQLIEGTMYMHSNNVIHRDLKLGNLFLNKDLVMKIGDLGLATKLASAEDRRKTICGTPNYIAPEVIDGKNGGDGHSFEVDIWSMGVILYTLLVGKPPYESKDVKATYQRILRNEYSFPPQASVSQQAKDLIGAMLQRDPSTRPTLDAVRNHAFFTKAGFSLPKSLPSLCAQHRPTWDITEQGTLMASFHDQTGAASTQRVEVAPKTSLSSPQKAVLNAQECRQNMPKSVAYSETRRKDGGSRDQGLKERDTNIPALIEKFSAGGMNLTEKKASEKQADEGLKQKSLPLASDTKSLEVIQDHLSNFLKDVTKASTTCSLNEPIIFPEKNSVWVTRYVDYTSKYGLGFLLNNGSAGVYFNDSTKAILSPDGKSFNYVQRCKKNQQTQQCTDMPCVTHEIVDYPEALKKKVTLLKHFCGYLYDQDNGASREVEAASSASGATNGTFDPVYLKKWVRTRHAVFFRLSNDAIQVVFFDHSEVLLSSDGLEFTYVDKQRRRKSMTLNIEKGAPNAEAIKRLKYTKDILYQLLHPGITSSNISSNGTPEI